MESGNPGPTPQESLFSRLHWKRTFSGIQVEKWGNDRFFLLAEGSEVVWNPLGRGWETVKSHGFFFSWLGEHSEVVWIFFISGRPAMVKSHGIFFYFWPDFFSAGRLENHRRTCWKTMEFGEFHGEIRRKPTFWAGHSEVVWIFFYFWRTVKSYGFFFIVKASPDGLAPRGGSPDWIIGWWGSIWSKANQKNTMICDMFVKVWSESVFNSIIGPGSIKNYFSKITKINCYFNQLGGF